MILVHSVRLAAAIYAYLDAYAPTNILLRTLRGSGRKWLAFSLSATLAVAYGLLGAWVTSIVDSGGPGWLNPLALLCAWNTIKFSWVAGLQMVVALANSGGRDSSRSDLPGIRPVHSAASMSHDEP